MGKVKKRKVNKSQNNIVPDISDEELPIDSKENVVQTILDQLQVSFLVGFTIGN